MAASEVSTYTPLEAPLPPLPEGEVFTELQWKTLLSLADVVVPSIEDAGKSPNQKTIPAAELKSALSSLKNTIEGPHADQRARQYLEENASSLPLFKESIHRVFGQFVHQEGRKGIQLILTVLK
jgi:hypothetical protein